MNVFSPLESRRLATALIVSALTVGAPPRPGHAQDALPLPVVSAPVETPAAPPPKPLRTLKDALGAMYWDAERRGPLLAVAPERVTAWRPREESDEIYRRWKAPEPLYAPPEGRGGLRVESVGPYFGRKLVRCGSVSVLAPTGMVLINTKLPPKPDFLIGMARNEQLKLLQASLTAAQWRQLGSSTGLGAGDLDAEQRALFLSILPNPFRLVRGKVSKWGGVQVDWKDGEDPNVILSDAQRSAVRVRLNRSATYQFLSPNNQPSYGVEIAAYPEGTEQWTVNSQGNRIMRGEQYGVKLRAEVPSRLKPGEIDFAARALDAPVIITGKKTVGELVAVVREKTGVELYVDGRAGKLAFWWGGGEQAANVRSGDLLKALCWSLTGVFRRVGAGADGRPVYILTDDVEGIGTRRARVQAWMDAGNALKQQMMNKMNEKIRAQQPLQYLSFAPDDPLAVGPSVQKKVEEKWKTQRGRYEGAAADLGELTEFQRQRVQEALARREEMIRMQPANSPMRNATVYADRVSVRVQTRLTYCVPGIGEVPSNDAPWDGVTAMLPPPEKSGFEEARPGGPPPPKPSADPAKLPATLPRGGVLCVAPATADEAVAAVGAARKRGLRQVWVQAAAPDAPETRAILSAAVAAGKEQGGIPVYAVVRLMQASATAAPDDRDINVLGETGAAFAARRAATPEMFPGMNAQFGGMVDYLRPDVPGTAPKLKQRLKEIASVPGLAGVVVKDAAAPGYGTPEGDAGYSYFGRAAADFGYTVGNRIALIRKAGYDPIDMVTASTFEVNLLLPNFTTENAMYMDGGGWEQPQTDVSKAWNGIRYEQQMPLLKDVYTAFRAAHPDIPVLIVNPNQFGASGGDPWVALWERADALPIVSNRAGRPSPPPPASSVSSVAAAGGKPGSAAAAAPEKPKNLLMYLSLNEAMMRATTTSLIDGVAIPQVEPGSPRAFSLLLNGFLTSFTRPLPAPAVTGGYVRPPYEGIVLDMTAFPMPQALRFIEEGIAPPVGVPGKTPTE